MEKDHTYIHRIVFNNEPYQTVDADGSRKTAVYLTQEETENLTKDVLIACGFDEKQAERAKGFGDNEGGAAHYYNKVNDKSDYITLACFKQKKLAERFF